MKPILVPGDVVFFKAAKKSNDKKSPSILFHGQGFGVLLGEAPPDVGDPHPLFLVQQMGAIGYVSFDDVGALLGKEHAETLIKMFEQKYNGKASELINAEAKVVEMKALSGAEPVDGEQTF